MKGRERAKKLREKWKEPHNCRGRWTHEGTSIDSFLDQVRAEGDERERLRDLKRQEPEAEGRRRAAGHQTHPAEAAQGVLPGRRRGSLVLTQRDFQPFPNFNFASMASTRCYTAATPST